MKYPDEITREWSVLCGCCNLGCDELPFRESAHWFGLSNNCGLDFIHGREPMAWPTVRGPWFYAPALALGAPCRDVRDCWPTNVRMSQATRLRPEMLSTEVYNSVAILDAMRCKQLGPYHGSICVLPCAEDSACPARHTAGLMYYLPEAGDAKPAAANAGVCMLGPPTDSGSRSHEVCRHVTDEYATCSRFAVRHHRHSSCSRSNAHGTCTGTLRCYIEGEQPHCDAPIPSASGCAGKHPLPESVELCAHKPKWPMIGDTDSTCPPPTPAEPRCGVGRSPCASGQLCVPLLAGQRCLDAIAPDDPALCERPGCWPDRPNQSLTGGDFPLLGPGFGFLPDATTPSDVGAYYDLRLDWSAARGMPCRDDDDCKIPFTSPFGQRRWLQGSLRCAEDTPGEGGYCLKPCDLPWHSPCHEGYACARGPGGWRWCMPEGGAWPPTCSTLAHEIAVEHGRGRKPCARSNPFGTCTGLSGCTKVGAKATCDAPESQAEACGELGNGDGIDQDCDGVTDEGCAGP